MHIGRQLSSQLFQTRQRHIRDGDIGTHTCGDTGSSLAYRSTTKDKYLRRLYAWYTSHQLSLTSFGLLEVIGTILCGHTSSYLTHRNQQRQRTVVTLHCLIGDTDSTTLHHRLRQLLLAGEMEIGEHHLSLTYQRIFRFDRFLHLHNHVSLRIDILYGRQYLRTHCLVLLIAEATALSCSMLYEDNMSTLDQLGNPRRGHAHSVLIVLNLLGDSYFHNPIVIS